MYKVLFNSLVHFQRYAPDKLFIAEIKKQSNSVSTVDRVMILALCTFLIAFFHGIKFHLIPLYTFGAMLRTNFLLQK